MHFIKLLRNSHDGYDGIFIHVETKFKKKKGCIPVYRWFELLNLLVVTPQISVDQLIQTFRFTTNRNMLSKSCVRSKLALHITC